MELVILVGLQGSGKSTFYSSRFADSHQQLSLDKLGHSKNARKRLFELLHEALRQGQSVVIDNTNPTAEVRASFIQAARDYNVPVTGYYLQSDLADCLRRNQNREGTARIPDMALYATSRKLEMPSFEEGFDRLFYVSAMDDGGFEVRPIGSS